MPYKDREKQRAYQKKWDSEKYARVGDQLRAYSNLWKDKNPEKTMLYAAKCRSNDRGIPFDIELSDVVIPEFCPILGIKLEKSRGQPGAGSPSLDRIVPEKGYTKGNVQVISHRANSLKGNATADELMAVAKYCKEHEDDSI